MAYLILAYAPPPLLPSNKHTAHTYKYCVCLSLWLQTPLDSTVWSSSPLVGRWLLGCGKLWLDPSSFVVIKAHKYRLEKLELEPPRGEATVCGITKLLVSFLPIDIKAFFVLSEASDLIFTLIQFHH